MTLDDPFLVPFTLSTAGLVIWALVFGGIADHWRTRRSIPTGAVAAFMVAVTGAVVSRFVGSLSYADPPLDMDIAALAAHTQRALLVLTGAYALVLLVRSRLRW